MKNKKTINEMKEHELDLELKRIDVYKKHAELEFHETKVKHITAIAESIPILMMLIDKWFDGHTITITPKKKRK